MHKNVRAGIILLFVILFSVSLSGCTANSADTYSKGLTSVLEKYTTWSTGILATYHHMLESATDLDPTLTYGDLIIGTIYTYQSGHGVSPSASWSPADVDIFQGTVQMLYDDAKEILNLMDKLTPPEDVAAAHHTLYQCVQYQANIAASMLLIFSEDKYEQLNYMSNPCDEVESALATLDHYLELNPVP